MRGEPGSQFIERPPDRHVRRLCGTGRIEGRQRHLLHKYLASQQGTLFQVHQLGMQFEPDLARVAGGIVIELGQFGIQQHVTTHIAAGGADVPGALAVETGAHQVGKALAGPLGPAGELILAPGAGAAAEDDLVGVVKTARGGVEHQQGGGTCGNLLGRCGRRGVLQHEVHHGRHVGLFGQIDAARKCQNDHRQ